MSSIKYYFDSLGIFSLNRIIATSLLSHNPIGKVSPFGVLVFWLIGFVSIANHFKNISHILGTIVKNFFYSTKSSFPKSTPIIIHVNSLFFCVWTKEVDWTLLIFAMRVSSFNRNDNKSSLFNLLYNYKPNSCDNNMRNVTILLLVFLIITYLIMGNECQSVKTEN